ncbi:SAM-dependent methyltransferase [Cupriavidus plantarum]|uniref:SAM-dependent methyltransferase n=1 Tax=Cupriavidus plantarum TaxID=942865 RepID=UPI0015CB8846|nr:SAM-dependent methyltransferase [Cupriavidus plantarum]
MNASKPHTPPDVAQRADKATDSATDRDTDRDTNSAAEAARPKAPKNTEFEAIFALPDPWGFESLWYEARKRHLLLAALPHRRYGQVFEPACANGLLTAALAERADHVLAMDIVPQAIALATERLAAHRNITLQVGALPRDWPARTFDLIVLSEFGYYLSAAQWRDVAARAAESVSDDGVIVACHWARNFEGRTLSTRALHRCIGRQPRLHRHAHHLEPDFQLDVWSPNPRPLRSREEAQ